MHCPPGYTGPVLLREAPLKAKQSAKKQGIAICDAGVYTLNKKTKQYDIDPVHPYGKFGETYPGTILKEFGERCDFDIKLTGRLLRRTMGFKVGNSGASSLDQSLKTRHSTNGGGRGNMTTLYQETSEVSAGRIVKSLQTKPSVLQSTGLRVDGGDNDDERKQPAVDGKKKKKKKKRSSRTINNNTVPMINNNAMMAAMNPAGNFPNVSATAATFGPGNRTGAYI